MDAVTYVCTAKYRTCRCRDDELDSDDGDNHTKRDDAYGGLHC